MKKIQGQDKYFLLQAISHFSFRLNALSLCLRGLPNGPTAPELEADPAVGVAHHGDGQKVGEEHEGHVVPRSVLVSVVQLCCITVTVRSFF